MKLFSRRPTASYSGHNAKRKEKPLTRVAITKCMFNNGGIGCGRKQKQHRNIFE